jgi:hypothetical protein
MGSSSPFAANQPTLQPGERVSGPLPNLPITPPATPGQAPQPAGKPAHLPRYVGSILSVLGSLLVIVGMFLPTYLAKPLLTATFSNAYCCYPYLDASNASLTGAQVLLLQTSISYWNSLGLLALQALIPIAAINTLGVVPKTQKQRRVLSLASIWTLAALVILGCMGLYFLLYLAVLAVPTLILLTITLRRSDRTRFWLRLVWPIIGIGALIGSTDLFFSNASGVLLQAAGPTNYSYDYLASLGPGAWLSFAGLLMALLGGVLVFQARKQAAASPP